MEINPEYSLERLTLKFQYFGHQMRKANSLEMTLMVAKTEGRRRRRRQRMRRLDGITDSIDMSLNKSGRQWRTGKQGVPQSAGPQIADNQQQQSNVLLILFFKTTTQNTEDLTWCAQTWLCEKLHFTQVWKFSKFTYICQVLKLLNTSSATSEAILPMIYNNQWFTEATVFQLLYFNKVM